MLFLTTWQLELDQEDDMNSSGIWVKTMYCILSYSPTTQCLPALL